MKLTGKKLDIELAKRYQAREARLNKRLTLRKASEIIGKEMGMTPEEYMDWEKGYDICPHKKYKETLGGIPPEFVMKCCIKCGKTVIVKKLMPLCSDCKKKLGQCTKCNKVENIQK